MKYRAFFKRFSIITLVFIIAACISAAASTEDACAAAKKPGKVTIVSVKSVDHDAIKISWKKAANAKSYQVYRSGAKYGKYVLVKTTTSKSFTNKKLTTGKKYYYKVRAVNGSKKGAFSSKIYAVPKLKKVVSVKVPETTASSIKLSWSKVNGAKGYQIYRATSEKGSYKKVGTTSKLYFKNIKLAEGKIYYYKVRAYKTVKGANQLGQFSAVKKTNTKAAVKKVQNLRITAQHYDGFSVAWNEAVKADGYQLEYTVENVWGVRTNRINNITETNRTVNGLRYKDYYQYCDVKVRAYRICNGKKYYGAWSNAAEFTLEFKDPDNLKSEMRDGKIKVTWENVPGADGYYVYRDAWNRTLHSKKYKITDANCTELIDEDLTEGVTYQYGVAPYQIFGDEESYSLPNNEVSIKYEPVEYSYELYFLEDYTKQNLYSNFSTVVIYVKTDDPDLENFVFTTREDYDDSEKNCGTISPVYFDDLAAAIIDTDDSRSTYGKVPGGFVCVIELPENGANKIRLLEYEDSYCKEYLSEYPEVYEEIANFELTGLEWSDYYDKWLTELVADNTTEDMNPLEKMKCVTNYLNSDEAGFRYLTMYKDTGKLANLALGENKWYQPYWESKRWDSYESPAVLAKIASEYIGGFDAVDNMYDNYSYGTQEWSRYHYVCRVTYDGKTYDFQACPLTYTGYITGYEVPDFNDTSWMYKVN